MVARLAPAQEPDFFNKVITNDDLDDAYAQLCEFIKTDMGQSLGDAGAAEAPAEGEEAPAAAEEAPAAEPEPEPAAEEAAAPAEDAPAEEFVPADEPAE